MSEIFEILMLVCFGMSWPTNIIKSIKSKTAKGRSSFFLYLVLLGYICGITAKLVSGHVNYVLTFYCLNLAMVLTDLILLYVNKARDKKIAKVACDNLDDENKKKCDAIIGDVID